MTRVTTPMGRRKIMGANTRRIYLTLALNNSQFVSFSVNEWLNNPVPNDRVTYENSMVLFAANSPYGQTYDYQYWGAIVQSEIWVDDFFGGAIIEYGEVMVDCPYSSQFGPGNENSPVYPRLSRAPMIFGNPGMQICQSDSSRVALTIFREGSGDTRLRFGSNQQSQCLELNGSAFPYPYLTRGNIGDIVTYPVFTQNIPDASATYRIVETLLA